MQEKYQKNSDWCRQIPVQKSLLSGGLFACLILRKNAHMRWLLWVWGLGLILVLPHLMLLADPTGNSSAWTSCSLSLWTNFFLRLLIYLPRAFRYLPLNWVETQHLWLLQDMFWTKKTFPLKPQILWTLSSKFTTDFSSWSFSLSRFCFCCQLE